MKQTRRPCNIPTHRARRKHATDEAKPPPDVPTDRIQEICGKLITKVDRPTLLRVWAMLERAYIDAPKVS